MNKVSKITVKHFINTSLKGSKEFMEKYTFSDDQGKKIKMEPLFYPLYVKITFQRATTQMKSLYELDFTSIGEAEFKLGELLSIETEMITDVITGEYKRLGSKFLLKGIPDKCRIYSRSIKDLFLKRMLMDEYNALITKSDSKYKPLLIWSSLDIPAEVYYDAAIKLLDEKSQIHKLKNKFELCSQFHRISEKNNLGNSMLLEWKYGAKKEKFHYDALKFGLTNKQINMIINSLDEFINTI